MVKIVDFIENIDKKGKNFSRFIEDLLDFLKDVLVYKNSSKNMGILEKKEAISNISEFYSGDDIYNFIIKLNDLSIRIKNTSFIKILLITEFIRLSNDFCNKMNVKSEKNETLIVRNVTKVEEKEVFSTALIVNESKISDKNKKIRINNAFATASKEYKNKFINNWQNILNRVSNDTNYNVIAGMINDIDVLVVGENHVIFLANYDSLLDRLFVQIDKFEKLLLDTFSKEYKVMFLLKDEWDYEMKKYVNNIKSGVKYQYISEDIEEFNNNSNDDDISKVISLLGNDVISYE